MLFHCCKLVKNVLGSINGTYSNAEKNIEILLSNPPQLSSSQVRSILATYLLQKEYLPDPHKYKEFQRQYGGVISCNSRNQLAESGQNRVIQFSTYASVIADPALAKFFTTRYPDAVEWIQTSLVD